MSSFIISLVAIGFVLGFLILIHEFGHYAVAKLCGVRVEVFSIGFGKRLLGFRRGDTDYRISALPLGGYVKMAGENPMEEHPGAPDEFMSHPRWQRLLIAFAGPGMNILLAVGLLTGIYMVHYEHTAFEDQPATIGYVQPGSPAANAGIQTGDRLIRVDNVQDPTWQDVEIRSVINQQHTMEVALLRSGHVINTKLVPQFQGNDQPPFTGLEPLQPIMVSSIDPSKPAYQVGIRVGDEITAVNGQPMHTIYSLQRYLQENQEKQVEVSVSRKGETLNFKVTPILADNESGDKTYQIGFSSSPIMKVDRLPFAKAFSKSVEQNKKFSFLIVEVLQKLAERKVSMKQVDGPIGMARIAGQVAQEPTWFPLLSFMAMLSINLAIVNLLPIPILDGGLIMLLFIESLLRRDINQRLKERIYQTAFVFLVLFTVIVIYNDVSKLMG